MITEHRRRERLIIKRLAETLPILPDLCSIATLFFVCIENPFESLLKDVKSGGLDHQP